jgi:outer membrane protein TolC
MRGTAPSPPLDRWWNGVRDPLLTTIRERAREQNLHLAAALARADQLRAAAHGTGAALFPTGNATRPDTATAAVASLRALDGGWSGPVTKGDIHG